MSDPVMFSDLRAREAAQRKRLESRQLLLRQLGDEKSGKRPRTRTEDAELLELNRRLVASGVVDPLFQAVARGLGQEGNVKDHWQGLLPTQLRRAALHRRKQLLAISQLESLGKKAEEALALDPETTPSTEQLETVAALLDRIGRWPNDPPDESDAASVFRMASRAEGDGAALRPSEVPAALERFDIPEGPYKAVIVDATTRRRFDEARAFTALLLSVLKAPADDQSLRPEERLVAAVVGLLAAEKQDAPALQVAGVPEDSRDSARKQQFGIELSKARGEYLTNRKLFDAVLKLLVAAGKQGPIDSVSAEEWAKVVRILLKRGVVADEPQLGRRVDEALDSVQNVGDKLPPSLIGIELPDLDEEGSADELIPDNIRALQPAYFAAMFEEMRAFQVVDKLVELFQAGVLPIGRGEAGNALFRYWKDAALRVSEAERRSFYSRTLGIPGGSDEMPNREFNDLWLRFVSAVSSFVRQNNVDDLLRTKIPGSISQQQVRKAARDLGANLSLHGYGIAWFMATDLQSQVKDLMKILSEPDIKAAYGARDMWQVIDQVSALELGGGKNTVRYRTMAASGAIIIAWLAKKSRELSTSSFHRILDIEEIRMPSPRAPGTKATTDPNDFDLVSACEQWLAVTGTQEELIENYAQPRETPAMPSRPIQIPAIARDMLESVGAPALGLSTRRAGNGYARN